MKTKLQPLFPTHLLCFVALALACLCLNSRAQTFTVLKHFAGTNGANPCAEMMLSGDTLYGTTYYGGTANNGTVFRINTDGSDFTVLREFIESPDGARPVAGLVLVDGSLYGTTVYGGSIGAGTVYKMNTDGTDYTVLKSFTYNDGMRSHAALALLGNTLYGVTESGGGGDSGYGTVFKLHTDGTDFTVLKTVTKDNGASPIGGLTLSGNTLYGTTHYGGSANCGTVFRVNIDGSDFITLKTFTNSPDGAYPRDKLIIADSTLYGTTSGGGGLNGGIVFKLNTDGGGFTVLKSFTNILDGSFLDCALVLSGNTLYGTAETGGAYGNGTIFKINTDGTGFAVLTNFESDGESPSAGLTLSGNTLYGTTFIGGSNGLGTVFALQLYVPPTPLVIVTTNGAFGFTGGQFGFTVTGPAGSNAVVSASPDLQTWTPIVTNLLVGGTFNFTNTLTTNYPACFYRAMLSP